MCTVSCGAWLHEGQLSEVPGTILALLLFCVFDHPDLSWAKMILVALGSRLSVSDTGGGCRFITLLWLSWFLTVNS